MFGIFLRNNIRQALLEMYVFQFGYPILLYDVSLLHCTECYAYNIYFTKILKYSCISSDTQGTALVPMAVAFSCITFYFCTSVYFLWHLLEKISLKSIHFDTFTSLINICDKYCASDLLFSVFTGNVTSQWYSVWVLIYREHRHVF